MAAVGALQQIQAPPQVVAIDVQSNPQDERVAEASKGFFHTVKETAYRIWNATLIGFHVAGDKISFVFFRVLEWVHPSLGPKIENVFLRVSNIWQAIKDAWKAEEIQKEIDGLRVQNYELHRRTRDYDQVVLEKGQLTEERNRFQQESHALLQAKNFAEEALRQAQHQEQNILVREREVVAYRDLVVGKNGQLEQANAQLIRERDEARQALAGFVNGNQDLLRQLAAAQQQILDLQQLIPNHQEMGQQFAVVADAVGKVRRIGERGDLDERLETLVPLFRDQIAQAKEKLDRAKATLIPNSPAAIALQSFERIMGGIDGYLEQVAESLQLHGDYQAPVNCLLLNLRRPIEV